MSLLSAFIFDFFPMFFFVPNTSLYSTALYCNIRFYPQDTFNIISHLFRGLLSSNLQIQVVPINIGDNARASV